MYGIGFSYAINTRLSDRYVRVGQGGTVVMSIDSIARMYEFEIEV
jgi:hypothetical protein